MKVIFSHGKESGPWGGKITKLASIAKACGFEVDSVDYQDLADPDSRVARLVSKIDEEATPVILVGSSMGGYVSLVASASVDVMGVFLLAPALYMEGYKQQDYKFDQGRVEIVHGWSDDVVPYEGSVKYASQAKCGLHLIDGDHRLDSSLLKVAALFSEFLVDFTE